MVGLFLTFFPLALLLRSSLATAWPRVQHAIEVLRACLRKREVRLRADHFDAGPPNSRTLGAISNCPKFFYLVWQDAEGVAAPELAQLAGHTARKL